MPNITVGGEDDFQALADGAQALYDAGDLAGATRLDKMARKLNAKLSLGSIGGFRVGSQLSFGWQDVPSTLQT